MIQALNGKAAASTLTVNLLKTITLTGWVEQIPKTKAHVNRDKATQKLQHLKALRRHIADESNRLDMARPIPQDPAPQEPLPTHKDVHLQPTMTMRVMRLIIKRAYKARDYPKSEKKGTITGLPKPGQRGLIRSTDTIRPLTVSPIIGRVINAVLAKWVGRALADNHILDPAGHAFLPGLSIHDCIATWTHCARQSSHAEDNTKEKAMYTILYDISKAYDTTKWSSIIRALENMGFGNDFIDYVQNSLLGTELRMRTNLPGRTTPTVMMHRAIKQGCPLAPLLFVIVMDELHRGYRDLGGYDLHHGPKHHRITTRTSSLGFCDDTAILASSMEQLLAMHTWTHKFFTDHNFQINTIKSNLTARQADGLPFLGTVFWPGNGLPITTIAPDTATRYLGAYVSLDLIWDTQIHEMDKIVKNLILSLHTKQMSILQGCMYIRNALGQKMEIGLRHADIPHKQLVKWDTDVAAALVSRAALTAGRIHKSSVATILQAPLLEHLNALCKTMQIMETLTKVSPLRDYYRHNYDKNTGA